MAKDLVYEINNQRLVIIELVQENLKVSQAPYHYENFWC
jgi:hypothetical protein